MEGSKIKKAFFVFLVMGSLVSTSCLSLIGNLASGKNPVPQLHWSVGQFVNEWDEPTGKSFTRYDGTVSAMFYSGNTKATTTIKELTFSEAEGFVFVVPSVTGRVPGSGTDVDLTIKLPDNTEKNFTGFFYFSSGRYKVRTDYSEDLRDTLLTENIEIRLSMGSNGRYRYQFKFPEKFNTAYQKLMAKQTTN
jgi:hypothetical protein